MPGDTGQRLVSDNDGQLRIEYDNGRLIVRGASLDIMLAGKDDSGNPVVKIAKAGIDVKTATDDQLIFNSNNNLLKILRSGTATIPSPGTVGSGGLVTLSTSISFADLNLSSRPLIVAYGMYGGASSGELAAVDFSGVFPIAYYASSSQVVTTLAAFLRREVSNSSVTFYSTYANGNPTGNTLAGWTIKYYIMTETAT